MSALNDLRTLLIDARIALRREMGHFEEDPLSKRLEKAIREITEEVMPPPSASTKTSAQQVALAWQTIARGLKLTHAELYGQMSERVMNLLNVKELVEPVTELLQLEEQVKKLESAQTPLRARVAELSKKANEAQGALDELHKALAAAVPKIAVEGDANATALQRLAKLIEEATAPKAEVAAPSAGGKPSAAAKALPDDAPIPHRGVLEAVAANSRQLTKEQREWCVGECMAITGWQYTPVELIENGDSWMAAKILEAGKVPG